jgi:site-specific DNA-methyltransferase (adenine-specific)
MEKLFHINGEKSYGNMERSINGDIKLFCGDSLKILNNDIQDSSIDLIFADPPYNIGKSFGSFKDKWPDETSYLEWCYLWLSMCLNKLKPNGALYLMSSTQAMPFLDIFLRSKMTILSRIVWNYDSSGVQAKKFFGSIYEPILYAVKNPNGYTFNAKEIQVEAKTGSIRKLIDYRKTIPTLYNNKKVPGNVWNFPRVRYRMQEYENHPTQKPEILLERIIKASSNENDLVLDPFAGTFTTCAVANRLKRRTIGIELNNEYFKIGLRRLNLAAKDKTSIMPKKFARIDRSSKENLVLFN